MRIPIPVRSSTRNARKVIQCVSRTTAECRARTVWSGAAAAVAAGWPQAKSAISGHCIRAAPRVPAARSVQDLFVFGHYNRAVRYLLFAYAAALTASPTLIVPDALRFEPNVGQSDSRVQFIARSSRYSVFLTTAGAVLAARDPSSSVRIRFARSNPSPLEGQRRLPGTANYFRGSQAFTNVPSFERVFERNVYPGIDAVFHGEAGQLEY